MAETRATTVVRLDDPELLRWLNALVDDELSTGLRSVLARAQHLVVVIDLLAFDEIDVEHIPVERAFDELRQIVAPVREAADSLSQAFVTVGHIDVHAIENASEGVGARRLRASSSLNGIRRLIAREWRILGDRLKDDSIRSSPSILVSFCRAHLDRIRTLVECIAPTLYAVIAPPGTQAEGLELQGSLTIRATVVDFHRTVHDVARHISDLSATEWLPCLHRAAEALDRILYSDAVGWIRDADQVILTESREILDESLSLWSPLRSEPTRQLLVSLERVAESLLRINDRPSLLHHDLRVLDSVADRLERYSDLDAESQRNVEGATLVQLDAIGGRDPALDALAANGLAIDRAPDWGALLARVQRVRDELKSRIR